MKMTRRSRRTMAMHSASDLRRQVPLISRSSARSEASLSSMALALPFGMSGDGRFAAPNNAAFR
jgi:hypothetical protein